MPRIDRRRLVGAAGALGALRGARAQTASFPSRPVKLLVGFAPGGAVMGNASTPNARFDRGPHAVTRRAVQQLATRLVVFGRAVSRAVSKVVSKVVSAAISVVVLAAVIAVVSVGTIAGAVAAAGETPPSALSTLTQTGEVSCRPSLPFFCGNLHVSCAGRTSIETFAFKLRATRTHGSIDTGAGHETLQAPYRNAHVEWEREGTYVMLLPRLESGYIKLLADGTYSFRHYAPQGAVMSTGRCE